MTACSNHPGTVKGSALRELVAESEKLHRAISAHIAAVAGRYGIDYEAFELLDRLAKDAGQTEERGLALLRLAGLATGEAPNIMVTTEGRKAHAAINNARFDWLDKAADKLDVETVHQAAEMIRKISV